MHKMRNAWRNTNETKSSIAVTFIFASEKNSRPRVWLVQEEFHNQTLRLWRSKMAPKEPEMPPHFRSEDELHLTLVMLEITDETSKLTVTSHWAVHFRTVGVFSISFTHN